MRRIAAVAGLALIVYAATAFVRLSPTTETVRLQVRLDSVLTELSVRDVSHLSAIQRSQRAGMIATLRQYRERGLFPNNYDFPGQAVPYFVDRKTSVLCAVAYLMESTGRRDMVNRVAAMNNNVWVRELASDTAFRGWLDANGLTLAEAARIQVPYVGGSVVPAPVPARLASSRVASTAAVGAVSLAATYFSARVFVKHRQRVAARREVERSRVSVAPIVSPSSGAGVTVSLKF